jgi:hypothetical protein
MSLRKKCHQILVSDMFPYESAKQKLIYCPVSPAEVQNFLQGCRGDPVMALNDIEAWVAEGRSARATDAE